MFSHLSDKLWNTFEALRQGLIVKPWDNRAFGSVKSVPPDVQAIPDESFERFYDLDYLAGSWVADEAFDDAVKAFDLIDQPINR